LEIGYFSGHLLRSLGNVISEIFLPILTAPDAVADAQQKNAKSGLPDSAKSELGITLQKFSSFINQTLQQIAGDSRLKIPDCPYEDVAKACKDAAFMQTLTNLSYEWLDILISTVTAEINKKPQGNGPLAEIEFWRDRNACLSSLYEKINQPKFRFLLSVLNANQVPTAPTIEYQLTEVTKYYLEANDNVKFLTTLERHFKNLVIANLKSVAESLPSLMNAIRMVWIISRHYNRDERMVPLMCRIAWQLAARVSQAINVKTIFRGHLSRSKAVIADAKMLLDSWSKAYFEVRDRIEASGRDQRWEFDRKKLFEQTNYMSARCSDLSEIVGVLDEFYSIFGPELKAVTGDPQQIDEVLRRVETLILPIEQASFDVFDKKYQNSWDSIMLRFRDQIVQIEEMAKQFIDASFSKLRSAEGAFDLLQNLQNIKTRKSINDQMMSKFNDILIQFNKEIDVVDEMFRQQR
jgi:dynein heavy chain